ncbi:MAG: polysaccharide deacetylase family protein, partial [Deltaproteobacteria bacterium]
MSEQQPLDYSGADKMVIKNLLTVDVEDWYHICDIEHLLPPSQWDRCESRVLVNVEKILGLFDRFHVK